MTEAQELLPPQPRAFNPAGVVTTAHMQLTPPPFIRPHRYTGRRAQGVRYEKHVHMMLSQRYPGQHVQGPWLRFYSNGKPRWCQPDALLVDITQGRIVVLEVKYQHTADAWWQLNHLYVPVLRAMFPPTLWALSTCEIVKWYDPATWFPCRVAMLSDPMMSKGNEFGVHIWRKGAWL